MNNKKILGIVSTPYHLMVLLFIKEHLNEKNGFDRFDVVITDKTSSLKEVFESGRLLSCFDNAFFADSKKIKNPYKGAVLQLYESFIHNPEYDRMFAYTAGKNTSVPDPKDYTDVFFASPGMPDEVSKEIIKAFIRKNRRIRFHRYEDGFASYTKAPVSAVTSASGRLLYRLFLGFDIKKAENRLLMFEPALAEKNVADTLSTGFKLVKIPKDEKIIRSVTEKICSLLLFEPEKIPAHYLFLGQGTDNVTNNPKTYSSLIVHIAEKTGFEDFCMKPHPRGKFDRFDNRIHLYENSAPFELCFAGGQMEDKTLISYYSTACVSGKLLFNSKCRIIFTYPLAGDSFNEKCDYEDYFEKLQKLYDNVYIARTQDELDALLESACLQRS